MYIMNSEIEMGPIRPPSEAESTLLRVTRNCSWNKCRFCNLYKGQRFSTRPIEDIKSDIDKISAYGDSPHGYMYNSNSESVFSQDANTMVLTYDKLKEILVYLREKLPQVKRVTSYGRVDSMMKFSVPQLTGLKEAGLDRIHSGYESGSDKVLALLNKGHTKAQEIEAGRKVMESGIELSVYFMPGAGGAELSENNATETADVVNKVGPDFVRIRTFVSQKGAGIFEDIDSGRIKECTDREKMLELKKMIEHLEVFGGYLYSDHIVNLLEEVNGNMKDDKSKMLEVFEAFERLDPQEQLRYQLARRMAMVRAVWHMELLSAEQREKIDAVLSQLDSEEKFETFLLRFLRHYI